MFDVLVIGAGHAGCEAATAAARRGARVGLVTFTPEDAGQMSCNPSIGGVGKGHLVRELDVYGGLMAPAADAAAIHRRLLNRSKGPAVWGPRVQADRDLYRAAIGRAVERSGVAIICGEAQRLSVEGGRVAGLIVSGQCLSASAVVIATGTFLDARLFVGNEVKDGGRRGGRAAVDLACQVRDLGFAQGRLKTGTPPRLDGRTIDWSKLEEQPSDVQTWSMSAFAVEGGVRPPQICCSITRTTEATHDLIAANLDRSPLFAGAIEGRGPRYCPSIEDKVKRFADRDSHQIFLEPEGLGSHWIYPNGISTSLPRDVQDLFVRSIPGLERAAIIQHGYAVEYEFADPRGLSSRLESKDIAGLFMAGQINGTTGYEEAAAQGLVAGLNAAAHALDLDDVTFDRHESYIGVMIDDLVIQGVSEPYRMMTARAENRLWLRADNAVTRLGLAAVNAQCLSEGRRAAIDSHLAARGTPEWRESEEGRAEALYAPYVERHQREWARISNDRTVEIPVTFDFSSVPGLSSEMIERLSEARPDRLDQIRRISGITPAAIGAVYVALQKQKLAA